MAEQWYYAEQGQQRGPVAAEELRQLIAAGQVTRANLVWREGMPDWVQAGTIRELFDGQAPTPTAAQPTALTCGSPSIQYYNPTGAVVVFGGFWLRFVAAVIDGLVMFIPNMLISGMLEAAMRMPRVAGPRTSPLWMISVGFSGNIASWLLNWLYFALMESSTNQATLGKMACGLIVTDLEGNRISFGRATGRYFAKFLSQMILYIGFMMAGWTEKKQALHDMIANTLVIRKTLPRG